MELIKNPKTTKLAFQLLNVDKVKTPVYFFQNILDFRSWLNENHKTKSEIQVGYYKKKSDKYNYSWEESVEHALCFGWIDGIRQSIDDISYTNRFTPRKPKSNWSDINIKKFEKLVERGLMEKAGIEAFERKIAKSLSKSKEKKKSLSKSKDKKKSDEKNYD